MKRRRWRRLLLEVLVLAAVVSAVHVYQTRHVARGAAPAFETGLVDGGPVSLADYLGRPLLLQFWATWCPVCRLEQGSIDAIAGDHQVLAVALDDMSAADMQRWLDARGLTYPVALDADGGLARLYGINGVPASIIVDAEGMIRFVEVGYTSETGLRLRLWWAGR